MYNRVVFLLELKRVKANIVSQRKCHVLTRTFTCTILVLGGDVHISILVSEGEPFLHVERDALSIPGDSKHVCRYWPWALKNPKSLQNAIGLKRKSSHYQKLKN